MMFDPTEFYGLIENNPDADIMIVDDDGEELRTFNTKLIWEDVFLDRCSDSKCRP